MRKLSLVSLAALVLVFNAPGSASAQSSGPVVSFVADFGLEFGGDVVAELLFTDGSTQKLHAGQGGSFGLGVLVRPREGSPFDVRATVGYKFVTNASENADIGIDRVPLKLLATYRFRPDWMVGGGLVRHTSTTFNGDGFAPDVDFEDANGAMLELAWRGVSLSYTMMDYVDENGGEYNASAFGISYRWVVNKRAR